MIDTSFLSLSLLKRIVAMRNGADIGVIAWHQSVPVDIVIIYTRLSRCDLWIERCLRWDSFTAKYQGDYRKVVVFTGPRDYLEYETCSS